MNTMEVNGVHELSGCRHSSKYIPLCSAEERKSYRYETTWGWVNYDRILTKFTIAFNNWNLFKHIVHDN